MAPDYHRNLVNDCTPAPESDDEDEVEAAMDHYSIALHSPSQRQRVDVPNFNQSNFNQLRADIKCMQDTMSALTGEVHAIKQRIQDQQVERTQKTKLPVTHMCRMYFRSCKYPNEDNVLQMASNLAPESWSEIEFDHQVDLALGQVREAWRRARGHLVQDFCKEIAAHFKVKTTELKTFFLKPGHEQQLQNDGDELIDKLLSSLRRPATVSDRAFARLLLERLTTGQDMRSLGFNSANAKMKSYEESEKSRPGRSRDEQPQRANTPYLRYRRVPQSRLDLS